MQELLFGTWGPQIMAFGGQTVAFGHQYPGRVLAGAMVVCLLLSMMFADDRSFGDGDAGFFGDGDGDGGGD